MSATPRPSWREGPHSELKCRYHFRSDLPHCHHLSTPQSPSFPCAQLPTSALHPCHPHPSALSHRHRHRHRHRNGARTTTTPRRRSRTRQGERKPPRLACILTSYPGANNSASFPDGSGVSRASQVRPRSKLRRIHPMMVMHDPDAALVSQHMPNSRHSFFL